MFVKICIEKEAECNPLIPIVARNSEAICPKVLASHDLLKKNVKNLIQQLVTLNLTVFEIEDGTFGKFLANEATTEEKSSQFQKCRATF